MCCLTAHAGRTAVFNLRKLETVRIIRIRGGTPAPAVRAVSPDRVKEFCFFHISPLIYGENSYALRTSHVHKVKKLSFFHVFSPFLF